MIGGYPATTLRFRQQDRIPDVALVGLDRRAVLQMHKAAIDAASDGACTVLLAPWQPLQPYLRNSASPCLRERLFYPLIGQPPRVSGRLHDDDFTSHMRVLRCRKTRSIRCGYVPGLWSP